MIQPFSWNKKWILASGVQTVGNNGFAGSRTHGAARTRDTFTVCWSDRGRWVPQAVLGQMFDTEEEAAAYLEANREMLEAAPGMVG